jgi:UrcA family protein
MKIIAIIAAAIVASAASAQTVPTKVRVSYADLNLTTAAGQAALASRIDIAADAACGVDANELQLVMRRYTARCHDAAVSRAAIGIARAAAPVYAAR